MPVGVVASKKVFNLDCDVPSQLFSYPVCFKIYLRRKDHNTPIETGIFLFFSFLIYCPLGFRFKRSVFKRNFRQITRFSKSAYVTAIIAF
jgi:hypothetical protein